MKNLGLGAGPVSRLGFPKGKDLLSAFSSGDGEGFGGGNGGNILAQMRGTRVYEELYERINEALDYPEELKEAGIEGVVKATVVFSRDGEFKKEHIQIDSPSRFLKVHVVRVLRQALRDKIPSTFTHAHEIRMRCTFYFELFRKENFLDGTGHAMDASQRHGVLGDSAAFYRAGKLIGQWSIGPLSGYGIAPSVGVDPDWFVKRFNDIFSKKAKIDPLEKYRNDPVW